MAEKSEAHIDACVSAEIVCNIHNLKHANSKRQKASAKKARERQNPSPAPLSRLHDQAHIDLPSPSCYVRMRCSTKLFPDRASAGKLHLPTKKGPRDALFEPRQQAALTSRTRHGMCIWCGSRRYRSPSWPSLQSYQSTLLAFRPPGVCTCRQPSFGLFPEIACRYLAIIRRSICRRLQETWPSASKVITSSQSRFSSSRLRRHS